jgi:hypothetical protein
MYSEREERPMDRIGMKLLVVLAVALVTASCSTSDGTREVGTNDAPDAAAACAEDQPECSDTSVSGDLPTGGEDPPAPTTDSNDEPTSGGMVIDGGVTVSDAIAYRGSEPVAVGGFVVVTSDGAHLCESLAESFPPQCGGARLVLVDRDALGDLVLIEEGDVQWSPDRVVVTGTVDGDELTVVATASA